MPTLTTLQRKEQAVHAAAAKHKRSPLSATVGNQDEHETHWRNALTTAASNPESDALGQTRDHTWISIDNKLGSTTAPSLSKKSLQESIRECRLPTNNKKMPLTNGNNNPPDTSQPETFLTKAQVAKLGKVLGLHQDCQLPTIAT